MINGKIPTILNTIFKETVQTTQLYVTVLKLNKKLVLFQFIIGVLNIKSKGI